MQKRKYFTFSTRTLLAATSLVAIACLVAVRVPRHLPALLSEYGGEMMSLLFLTSAVVLLVLAPRVRSRAMCGFLVVLGFVLALCALLVPTIH